MEIFDHTFLDGLADSVALFLKHQVFLAPILFLVLEEAGIPLPIPGDIIVIFTGYQVTRGAIAYPVAFVVIIAAVLIGSTILYTLSKRYGKKIVFMLGNYLHFDEEKLATVEKNFKKYGILVIIIGRHIPGFRIPITIFSGISDISYKQFILSTFVSVIFSTAFYLSIGQRMGPKAAHLLHAHHSLYIISILPILIMIIGYFYLSWQDREKSQKKKVIKRPN
ncbi:MAG TPA: DedA family protein [Candidatus Saccharimonadales bacterium]|nr:DedA family protein [Candidatus Saccharimonadales bacterium]